MFYKDPSDEKRGKSWRRDREDRGRKISNPTSRRCSNNETATDANDVATDSSDSLGRDVTGNEAEQKLKSDGKDLVESTDTNHDSTLSNKTNEDDCEVNIERYNNF